ncbi:LOW QUALITY PROTEIN: ornithine decarboxylase antizyme [Uranotaenia lowii]|uniref:LOW QUALITY PROTEIN: ornithine decarboxylase antizyme n=1 Tax=Uranotaenia lowii TaxID=190385 RepID=UPI00247ACDDF|nr:LOW QUALITY PROTEIN: ornithine decarboxylase antizyme [Uranotaenia lowii]
MANLEKLCRLCLLPHEDLESLHQFINEKESLLEIAYSCTQIRLTSVPGLPCQICPFCKMQLLAFSQFRKRCTQAENQLRSEFPDLCREAKLTSSMALLSCHNISNKDSSYIPCQQLPVKEEMSTISGWESQESLEFGTDSFMQEVLGTSVQDFHVEEISTTVTRQSTPMNMEETVVAEATTSSVREFTRKRSFVQTTSSEPSISSSNRACKRTISTSSSSSSSSSVGFDSYCVSLAVGPLWWSDVPTIRTDHDRASPLKEYNRKTSIDSTTTASSEYTDLDLTESTVDFMNQHEAAVIQEVLTQPSPTQITLKLYVTAQKHSTWETIFNPLDNMLYVNLPSTMSHEASKHSFISLLEFAEEKLECDGVVLCIRKDRLDRPNLVRTFSFVGFQPISSTNSPLTPPHIEEQQKNEFLFMIYNIEE